ncbi:MAG: alanine--tRNA ligase, partial [Planctomycetota bacterium]
GNVGVTPRHHTFFEMLGNFSFGDYFKTEAIHWAWEFLTDKKWLAIDPARLSITVYEDDDEAAAIWRDEVGIPAAKISRLGEHDNFWPAGAPSNGPDGVCGPCSEIFYKVDGIDEPVEIWNLVFTQFNRVGGPPDNLKPLPKRNIDTGMGLERTAAVLQGVPSNFEIDTLRPLCDAAGDAIGVKYDFKAEAGRALRRVADHARAITMCVHEGVAPGSKGEAYVVRQLLRRAVLEGFLLGRDEPFLHTLVDPVVAVMRAPYPDVAEAPGSIRETVLEEEKRFLETIDRGLGKFQDAVKVAKSAGGRLVSGDVCWDLHQTFGFLVELSEALAEKEGLAIDVARFKELQAEHEQTSNAGAMGGVMAAGPIDTIREKTPETAFLGYDATEADGTVVGIIADQRLVESISAAGSPVTAAVVLDKSPFYGEAGGQIGDRGELTAAGVVFEVLDTQKDRDLVVHLGRLVSGSLKPGDKVTAAIDADRRAATRRAHSATHVLHHALHEVLGKGATQRGSKVEPDQLRFDFNNRKALTPAQLTEVEDIVNARIADGAAVTTRVMPIEEAKKLGAMALFGEKYPDEVRVVTMGDVEDAFSLEFCGGTHLANTAQAGLCRIVAEDAVGTGIRRITAVTGKKALERLRESEALIKNLQQATKAPQPEDLPERVAALQAEVKGLKKELAEKSAENVAGAIDELLANAEKVGDVSVIAARPAGADRAMLKEFADQLRERAAGPVAAILAAEVDGKVALLAAVSKDLVKRGVKAGDCVKSAAKEVGGGGGGKPDLAEAGGKQPERIGEALAAGVSYFKKSLGQASV